MDIIRIIVQALGRILSAIFDFLQTVGDVLEHGLRGPLQQVGLTGIAQTIIVALVPLLTLIAGIRLLGGIMRIAVVSIAAMFLAYTLWPLVSGAGPQTF